MNKLLEVRAASEYLAYKKVLFCWIGNLWNFQKTMFVILSRTGNLNFCTNSENSYWENFYRTFFAIMFCFESALQWTENKNLLFINQQCFVSTPCPLSNQLKPKFKSCQNLKIFIKSFLKTFFESFLNPF